MIKKLVLIGLGVGVGLIGCELLLRLLVPKTAFVTGFDYEINLSTELFVRDGDFGAVEEGVELQETEADTWHPSRPLGRSSSATWQRTGSGPRLGTWQYSLAGKLPTSRPGS